MVTYSNPEILTEKELGSAFNEVEINTVFPIKKIKLAIFEIIQGECTVPAKL